MISLDLYYYIYMSHMSLTVLHFVEKLGLCTFIKWNLLTLQMAKWRFYQSFRPNQLRSCQSTAGTAMWGCRGFTYQRKLPSLAGCFLSPRATASTVDSTMSPCKIHKALHHSAIYLSLLFLSSAQPVSLLNLVPILLVFLSVCFSLFCSHIRWGAPPVINPIGSLFPNATLWSPSLSLILPVTSQSSTTFNLSNPAPGDWYVAAHLPEDDGRIEQKVCIELYTVLACYSSLCSCCWICIDRPKSVSIPITALLENYPCTCTWTCSTRAGDWWIAS